ncbi:transcriptional regulator, LysR family [Sphingomonas guangdongensis]|uniref:Transcriptional regulator, LysR family n=1 Tax=Sphingomonas guangdongensis TaxID=1141890 RepID=A0A285QG65_9SPHN|nr:LysR family transcriptional regulator [Sphingomonas guangdongensis]SOB80873.1 transcriptional regulator, LysR family [Sphingomonas guangdongensis]
MIDVSLAELRAFALVAQHRSFRRAADVAGVARPTLSHALRALETRLGTRLLHRTTRSVALTEAGERLLQRLAPTLRDLEDMIAGVGAGGDEVGGTLRINAPEGGARWLLRRAIPLLLERHPRVAVELLTEGRLVDIVAEGFDAGVRLREAVPQDMVAVPLGGDTRFIAVAAPAYLAQHGAPVTPADLAVHRCIRQRLPSGKAYRWEFERDGEEVLVDVPGALTLDNSALMVEAAVGGLGIAFVGEPYAADALGDGRLVTLLADWSPPFPGICLYYARNRQTPPALRALIDIVRGG